MDENLGFCTNVWRIQASLSFFFWISNREKLYSLVKKCFFSKIIIIILLLSVLEWFNMLTGLCLFVLDEMKTFAGQQIEPLFQFSWLIVFLTLLLCGGLGLLLAFTVDAKLGIAVSLSLLAVLYIFFSKSYFIWSLGKFYLFLEFIIVL